MYDLAIIGGGPAGYAAAIRAAQLGGNVALVEESKLGGTCLHWGCIPTKALIRSAHLYAEILGASEHGIRAAAPELDWTAVQARKDKVVTNQHKGLDLLVKSWGVTTVPGRGRVFSAGAIEVTSPTGVQVIEAHHILLATGSEPIQLPGLIFNGDSIISSDDALHLKALPKSLIVVGGGVIGCEMACLFAQFGVDVTIVELMPTILPMVDTEIVAILSRSLRKLKIKVLTGVKFESGRTAEGRFAGTLSDGREVTADKCLVVVGRRARLSGNGIPELGLCPNGKTIAVNDLCETSLAGVYAAGDATGKWMLAHSGYRMGEVAASNALGHHESLEGVTIPNGIFTTPEIGTVGLGEEEARKKYGEIIVGRYPYRPLGRAQAGGNLEGMFKIVADAKSRTVVGAHIIGESATELVHEGALAVSAGLKIDAVAEMVHSHPTLSEGFGEAAAASIGRSIHSPGGKK
ncbi:MAG: dihydrolipoyl dehydrogenase [Candidatus Brocadiia bacterium]